ncbi:MAG TPA: hypothetical protein VLH86_00500 [Patescibacteria group bacterium]|nr:hypothetical protein [Patescibacteria group bacterium]
MRSEEVDWSVLDRGPDGVVVVDSGGQKVERPAAPDRQPRGAGAAGSAVVGKFVEMPLVVAA